MIALDPVDAITVTTLVVADLLLPDEGPAKRYPLARAVEPENVNCLLGGEVARSASLVVRVT
jgi:hypothetical protein